MATQWIRIPRWGEFQHYRDRTRPPWIKLHRTLLDDRDYRRLPDGAQALLIDLWLLAAEHDGKVKYDLVDLEFRTRRPRDEIAASLQNLSDGGFVNLPNAGPDLFASNLVATCTTEEKRVEEKEEKRMGVPPELQELHDAVKRQLTGEESPGPRLKRA